MNAPPSIALAMMAKNLADQRYYGSPLGLFELQERDWYVDSATGLCAGASGEYYRIIDRISAGERP